jgi:hypothetical protein
LLDLDSIGDDAPDSIGVGTTFEVAEQQTSKVGVHTLVTADELVREGETGHQAPLLEPEDGSEGVREKDILDGGKRHQAFGGCRLLVRDPAYGPVGLALDARDSLDSVEEIFALGRLLDISVDEERLGFGMDILHHDLEAIEATSFSGLNLVRESLYEVLVDDAIGGGEEGEDMGDEMAFIIVKLVGSIVEVL